MADELSQEALLGNMIAIIGEMNPDSEDDFTRAGVPDANRMTALLKDKFDIDHRVTKIERDHAWSQFNDRDPAESIPKDASEQVATVTVDGQEYKINRSNLKRRKPNGLVLDWQEISQMWIDSETGLKFYEPVAEIKASNLLINPFLHDED